MFVGLVGRSGKLVRTMQHVVKKRRTESRALEGQPLVEFDVDGGLRVSAQARDTFAALRLDRPLVVLTVVGRSRTGKSFLLNRVLLGGKNAFGVDASIRACTKGLWFSHVPGPEFLRLMGVHEDEANECTYDVLVVDTEGINALDRDQSYDTRIFTLALLISSTLVYNSLGAIDESAISTLAGVTTIANSLKRKNGGERTSSRVLDLPSLFWVVRDFNLDIERLDENEPDMGEQSKHSDDLYLEEALSSDAVLGMKKNAKAMLRKQLCKTFPNRACHTMIRPVDAESDLKQLQDLPDSRLRPVFVDQMRHLRRRLVQTLRPKHVAGQMVTGPMFLGLLEEYTRAVSSGAVPQVMDAWTQIVRSKCHSVIQSACSKLDDTLGPLLQEEGALPSSPHPLQSAMYTYMCIVAGLQHASCIYTQQVLPTMRETFDRLFQREILFRVERIVRRWKEWHEAMIKESHPRAEFDIGELGSGEVDVRAWCRKIMPLHPQASLQDNVHPKSLPSWNVADVIPEQIWGRVNDIFTQASKEERAGSQCATLAPRLEEILVTLVCNNTRDETWKPLVQAAEQEAEKWRQELQSCHQTIEALTSERDELSESLQAREEECKVLQSSLDTARHEQGLSVTSTIDHLRDELQRVREEYADASETFETEMDGMHERLRQMQSEMDRVASDAQANVETSRATYEARIATLETERNRLQSQYHDLQQQYHSVQQSAENLQERILERSAELKSFHKMHADAQVEWASKVRESDARAAAAEAKTEALQGTCERLRKRERDADQKQKTMIDLEHERLRLEIETKCLREEATRLRERVVTQDRVVTEGMRAIRELQRKLR